jgi:uncharacterized membrane protein
MPILEESISRWTKEGVVDLATAERIRLYEKNREQPSGLRWQVWLALAFGGVLVAAGVSLFVAAHWDELSPASRFVTVMAILAVLHGAAIVVRERFEGLATALHGIGTVGAGAAIALVGQIFNIQEHWPAGILLWALCGIAGWALLGDQVQQTIAMLLIPAWILSEWWARTDGYRGAELYGMRMLAMFAVVYLTAFVGSRRKLVSGVVFAAAAIALLGGAAGLSAQGLWSEWQSKAQMPMLTAALGWAWIAAVPLLAAWWFKRSSVVPVAVVLVTCIVLPHLHQVVEPTRRYGSAYLEPSVGAYLWVGLLAAFCAWWGLRERSRALINYGIGTFALTVLWFYFSSVMDKLGRSFSLIMLGLLFLGGGWLLEKMRRKLVAQVKEAA